MAPVVRPGHIVSAPFAAVMNSAATANTDSGNPAPPYSTSALRPCQPASTNLAYASLNPAGVCTPSGLQVSPSRSPEALSGANTSCMKRPCSSSTDVDGLEIGVGVALGLRELLELADVAKGEEGVLDGCSVLRHAPMLPA